MGCVFWLASTGRWHARDFLSVCNPQQPVLGGAQVELGWHNQNLGAPHDGTKKRITTVSMSRGRPAPPGRQAQERHKSPSAVTGPSRSAPPPQGPSLTPASRAPACRGHCPAACRPSPRPRRRRPTGRTLTCGGTARVRANERRVGRERKKTKALRRLHSLSIACERGHPTVVSRACPLAPSQTPRKAHFRPQRSLQINSTHRYKRSLLHDGGLVAIIIKFIRGPP